LLLEPFPNRINLQKLFLRVGEVQHHKPSKDYLIATNWIAQTIGAIPLPKTPQQNLLLQNLLLCCKQHQAPDVHNQTDSNRIRESASKH